MSPRRLGIEEEMFLVDPRTAEPVPRSLAVGAVDDARPDGVPEDVTQELFLEQVETTTEPDLALDDVLGHVVAARRRAAADARAVGAALLPSSTSVVGRPSVVTPSDRYRRMAARHQDLFPDVAVCGMHVHVEVVDDEEAVRVVDRLAPWLPVVAALTAGSPFAAGADTGFASWRSRQWDRWPTAGPTAPFGGAAAYRRVVEGLVASGAAIDDGMVYLDARPGRATPTVEVRVCDVLADPAEAVAVAGLVRALVTTVAATEVEPWTVPVLRAARWLAQRDGVTAKLLHPVTARLVPAATATDALLSFVEGTLRRAGDLDPVAAAVGRLVADGGPATRARRVADGEPRRWAEHLLRSSREGLHG